MLDLFQNFALGGQTLSIWRVGKWGESAQCVHSMHRHAPPGIHSGVPAIGATEALAPVKLLDRLVASYWNRKLHSDTLP